MKKFSATLMLLINIVSVAFAQVEDPVSWSSKVDGDKVVFTAKIDGDWHMYDLGPYTGGPNATSFSFELPSGVKLDGGVVANTKSDVKMDDIFKMKIGTYVKTASFTQKFINTTGKDAVIKATVEWQVCDDKSCLPPIDFDFKLTIKPSVVNGAVVDVPQADSAILAQEGSVDSTGAMLNGDNAIVSNEVSGSEIKTEQKSMWAIIIEAILWGFAALLTPCVFPMVPMTVSFFIKSSESKARGRFLAAFYGISIVTLYTLPIAVLIAITYFTGGEAVTADIFNWLATHWIPNVLFFVTFLIFAISFFGAFEINMPSWLVGKADAKSDKGGLVGTFFMAITLVLVSFSCTGPIVGSVLVKSTQGGEIWEPIFTMFAFSTAFALPFTVFAFFPSLLKNLPKSGGWLNSVKVVLGFIELALGLKFLSVADQVYHWELLDREVYLALWIVIFSLLGLYLLGKLRFTHDSKMETLSVKRLFLSIASFTFVVYMIPGMWGAPLKSLSGYLPPMSTMDFVLTSDEGSNYLELDKIKGGKPKFSDLLHMPKGFYGFYHYKEGIEYAKAVNKPVLLDFTGHGCVNCRQMEANVWTDPDVRQIIREDYVLIAIYVDDKTELPQSEWIVDKRGKTQKTIGKINAAWQIERFGVNAQPYYCLINPYSDKLLVQPRAYNLDVAGFVTFLENGIKAYQAQK